MIWHFIEVWFLFLVVFGVGCALGSLLNRVLADGPLAVAQDRFASVVGDRIDHLKWRLGLAPDWRPDFHRSGDWPALDHGVSEAESSPHTDLTAHAGRLGDRARLPYHPRAVEEDDGYQVDGEAWTDEDVYPEEMTPRRLESVRAYPAGEPAPTDMMRPAGLSEPRGGVPDNLQKIWGIGKRNEVLLNSLGIYHFSQIASWTPAEARWVAARLTFPERLERDNWIGQAIVLATGGDPSSVSPSSRAKVPPSSD